MEVGGQVSYTDYLSNVSRFAVELVNTGQAENLSPEAAQMLDDHGVPRPGAEELPALLALIRGALQEIVDGAPPRQLSTLLRRYRPELYLSDHDGVHHIHFAADAAPARQWIGQTVGAALAHVAAGDPAVTVGRCAAQACPNFFVDQSRNRTRRFCSNACASRTTVAAHRARARTADPDN
jgi:predicted RNA-binding Zn ribbon-like protein